MKIHSFISEQEWLEIEKELSVKRSNEILHYVPFEQRTKTELEYVGTVYQCAKCTQRWIVHTPDYADRGYLLRIGKTNFLRDELELPNLSVFDEALEEIGLSPMLENANFELTELSSNVYLQFKSVSSSNRVSMVVEIFKEGVTFYIDRADEIFDWSTEQIRTEGEAFKEVVKTVFGSPIESDS